MVQKTKSRIIRWREGSVNFQISFPYDNGNMCVEAFGKLCDPHQTIDVPKRAIKKLMIDFKGML